MNSDRPTTPETPSPGDAPPESHAPQPAWERFLLAMYGANDGYYRLVRSCGAILRDAAGKPIRLGGWHIDLSENKRLTERLQQQTHVANMCTDVSLALARQPFLRVFLQHCVDALLAHLPLDW